MNNSLCNSPSDTAGIFYWTTKPEVAFDYSKKSEIESIRNVGSGMKKSSFESILGIESTDDIIFANKSEVMGSQWTVLNDEEWKYLYQRCKSNNKLFNVEIYLLNEWGGADKTFYGSMILPDNFVYPSGCSPEDDILYREHHTFLSYYLNTAEKGSSSSTSKMRQWSFMQENGAVFFPIPGQFHDIRRDDYNGQPSWFIGDAYWVQWLGYDPRSGDYVGASTRVSTTTDEPGDLNYDAALCDPYLGMIRMVYRVK